MPSPFNFSKPHHPPTLTMVLEAVRALSTPKGVSAFAIKRYILHQYPSVDPVRLKYYLKQALVKGVNQGYLVRPYKSSAQGASGSFKLGKEKAHQGKGLKKSSSDGKPAAKLEGEAEKQPKVKDKAPKQKAKSKDAEQVKKKTSSTKVKATLGEAVASTSGAKPKPQGLPKASKAKSTSGPKKVVSKSKAELKGVPETKAKGRPSRDESAKGKAAPKGAIARRRAANETKADDAKGKPKAKKGAAKGQEGKKATAGSEA